MDQNSRRRMSREKTGAVLEVVVKHFFIEKEVTSTLVMDSLYSGLKALVGQSKNTKSRPRLLDAEESPAPIVSVDKDMFVLVDDVLLLLERAALEPLPPKDEKGPQNRTKDGNAGEEFNKEAIERDESRLTELGRRTVEIFVLAHIFSNKIEAAYQEAIALKRQEELIREEEEAWFAESELRAKRGAEKDKKSKKKQGKQKRNKNKGKEKRMEEKSSSPTEDKDSEENQGDNKRVSPTEKAQPTVEKPDTRGDVSDISDSVDCSAEVLQPDSEDRDGCPVHWDTDTSEIHPNQTGDNSIRGRGSSISISDGVTERKNPSLMDDSSSTCSNDSIRSGVTTDGSCKGNSLNRRHHKSPSKGKNRQGKLRSDSGSLVSEIENQPSKHATDQRKQNCSSEPGKVGESEPERSGEHSPVMKKRNVEMKQKVANSVDMDHPKEKSTAVLSFPRSAHRNPTSERKGIPPDADTVPTRKVTSNGPPSSDQAPTMGARAKVAAPKPVEKLMVQPTPCISRSSSAPIIPPQMQPNPIVSMVQTTTALARPASLAGRLGPDPSRSIQTYIPQSYKSAIVGNTRVNSQPPPVSASHGSSGSPFSIGCGDSSSGGHLGRGGSSRYQGETTIRRPMAATADDDVELGRQNQSRVTRMSSPPGHHQRPA